MFADQITDAIGRASLAGCDVLARDIWRGYAAGVIADDQTEALSAALEGRRRALRGGVVQLTTQLHKPLWSPPTRFPPRRVQVSPDRRASIQRRRHLAASGPMPPALAAKFTVSELAVLRVVADEVTEKGVCSRTLAELSARAGCCRSTAQNALRAAAKAGLITIEERRRRAQKNLPNLIRITSAEWLAWLARGERRIGFKKTAPTDTGSRNRRGAGAWPRPTTAMEPLHKPEAIRSKLLIGERGGKSGHLDLCAGGDPRHLPMVVTPPQPKAGRGRPRQ